MKTHGLHDLAALKEALQRARREAEARAFREREAAEAAERERRLFELTVGSVQPLRKVAAPRVERPRPPATARQRERDEAAVLGESISDEFDVESLLETDEALSFRRRDIGPEVVRKLRRGVWALQGQLDLHGLRRDQARERLAEFLRESARSGLRCVRVIHGKGNGSPGREPVLKAKVRSWLVQRSEVLAFTQARASDGGLGALIVLLRPSTAGRVHRDPPQ
ncbi:MAG: Smr/MutS family protein [Caldimonas sp.]